MTGAQIGLSVATTTKLGEIQTHTTQLSGHESRITTLESQQVSDATQDVIRDAKITANEIATGVAQTTAIASGVTAAASGVAAGVANGLAVSAQLTANSALTLDQLNSLDLDDAFANIGDLNGVFDTVSQLSDFGKYGPVLAGSGIAGLFGGLLGSLFGFSRQQTTTDSNGNSFTSSSSYTGVTGDIMNSIANLYYKSPQNRGDFWSGAKKLHRFLRGDLW